MKTFTQSFYRLSYQSSTKGDIYDAVTFGASLSTRAAVGKVMVVLSCDSVEDGWFYADAYTMLKEGLIKLHYINPKNLVLKASEKKIQPRIFGYDRHSVFTFRNLKFPERDLGYRRQIKVPKVTNHSEILRFYV